MSRQRIIRQKPTESTSSNGRQREKRITFLSNNSFLFRSLVKESWRTNETLTRTNSMPRVPRALDESCRIGELVCLSKTGRYILRSIASHPVRPVRMSVLTEVTQQVQLHYPSIPVIIVRLTPRLPASNSFSSL